MTTVVTAVTDVGGASPGGGDSKGPGPEEGRCGVFREERDREVTGWSPVN